MTLSRLVSLRRVLISILAIIEDELCERGQLQTTRRVTIKAREYQQR